MISATSRYQRNATALVRDRKGRQQLTVLHRPPVEQQLRVSDFLWLSYSRVDSVAHGAFGAEAAWWMIGEANPQLLDWTRPAPGSRVMVPRGVA